MTHIETARSYLQAGLCVLPAILSQKRPALAAWRQYQDRLPTELEIDHWFQRADALCLVTGKVSGNLEMLDFDLGGEAFEAWYAKVASVDRELLNRLVIEQSPSGGWHVVYRSEVPVCGNLKLAQRRQLVDGPDEVTIASKRFKPRQDVDGQWYIILTLIETRGEGGIFLCAPSPSYELLQGDFATLPVLSETERDLLLEAAWSLNQSVPGLSKNTAVVAPPKEEGLDQLTLKILKSTSLSSDSAPSDSSDGRPGDDYNKRGDVRALLKKHGWTLVKGGDNEYWRRPGKSSGSSATLKDSVFFVFSSSAAPFEPETAYAPFSVYAHLEHHGDFAVAASVLSKEGFGGDPIEPNDVDLTAIDKQLRITEIHRMAGMPLPVAGDSTSEELAVVDDPGPIAEEMLRIPGYVSEVIDLCLKTAPYPNQPMSFCGALAQLAFLAGRKVRDPGDNRTNIYLLGLAHSSAGKDWIRKVNAKILHEIGLLPCLGDRLASGEGIQDALLAHPAMLFQSDEIDGLLQAINKAKDARHESIMTTLLSLYSAANSIFAMRPKSGKPDPGAIDQPHLVLFGTAIPNHYYEALSERMLTNGFFARQLVIEAGKRKEGQEPGLIELSDRVLSTAKWWADFHPGTGNLHNWHPVPALVEHSEGAKRLLVETRSQAEVEYAKAEDRGDPVGTTVWGRVSEQTRKLALLYAVSENHQSPRIDVPAVQWANRFVLHHTRRMLYMASLHVSESEFDHRCKRLLELLLDWASQGDNPWMPYREITRRLRWNRREHEEVRLALIDQERIEVESRQTSGRPGFIYRALVRRKPRG